MAIAEKTSNAWSSRPAFLMAAVGGAVGLGNLWRFPYIAGEYGGGGFVIIYLAFVFFLGVPLPGQLDCGIGARRKREAILAHHWLDQHPRAVRGSELLRSGCGLGNRLPDACRGRRL